MVVDDDDDDDDDGDDYGDDDGEEEEEGEEEGEDATISMTRLQHVIAPLGSLASQGNQMLRSARGSDVVPFVPRQCPTHTMARLEKYLPAISHPFLDISRSSTTISPYPSLSWKFLQVSWNNRHMPHTLNE